MQLTLAKIEIVGLQDKSLFRVRVECPYEASGLSDQCLSPGYCRMKRLGVFLLPLDGMLVHRGHYSIECTVSHLYKWWIEAWCE